MKRICMTCGYEYSPNVGQDGRMPKGYKVCPKCKSSDTKEKTTPKFMGTRFTGSEYCLERWNESVKHNNNSHESLPSVVLGSWRGLNRLEALGLC
jgi:hypothetical protein